MHRGEGRGGVRLTGGDGKSGVDGCFSLIEGRVGLCGCEKSWEEMAIGAEGQQQQQQTLSVRRRGSPWHTL